MLGDDQITTDGSTAGNDQITSDESPPTDESATSDEYRITRRGSLIAAGTGVGAVAGIGAISGSVAAWKRNDIDFKGCSEVWIIVAPEDIDPDTYDPPTVAHVIVERSDGTLDCRLQEFTAETTTTIPGQYGDAPVLKYAPPSSEKVLGVIIYNYSSSEDRFHRNSPLTLNPNRCADTPRTPDASDAPCAENTYLSTEYIQDGPGRGSSNGGNSRDGNHDRNDGDGSNGRKNGAANRKQ